MPRKIRRCLFILNLILISFQGFAQVADGSSLLWKISKKGIPDSYLFGTIHLICPSDFNLTDTQKNCLKKTDELFLELDMDDPGLMMAMTKSMMMTENRKLSKLLPAEDYQVINKFFQDSMGINIALFDGVKPFISMSMVFNKVLNCEPVSYELKLMELAKEQKKEVKGLETVEEQMAVFDSISYKTQAEMLLELVKELPKARREFAAMVKLYRDQDLEGLYETTLKSEFDMQGKEEILLTARNHRWVQQMKTLLLAKSAFYAVGAAHLPGKDGVIALLRQNGFTVEPVR